MVGYILTALGSIAGTLLARGLLWPRWVRWREARFARAERSFRWQRERLEAKFAQLGLLGLNGDSEGWIDCDFDDAVSYARERWTGRLSAYVGVTLVIPSTDDSGLGEAPSPDHRRDATAVFRFADDHWDTEGRVIFNLSPTEVLQFYRRGLRGVAAASHD